MQSRIGRTAGAVPHAQDCHRVAVDEIADDVGVGADDLAQRGSRHRTSAIRELLQAIAQSFEAGRYIARRLRIELFDVGSNGAEMRERRFSLDNLDQRGSGLGQGSSSGLPHESSHSATLA